jgi:hypothetical protein
MAGQLGKCPSEGSNRELGGYWITSSARPRSPDATANIRLLIETLDAEGKIIGQAQGTALGRMFGRDRVYFEVPLHATGASYRVRVLSWDTFGTGQWFVPATATYKGHRRLSPH